MARLSPISGARIKLRSRHLLEWQELSALQQTVLTSFRQDCDHKLSLCGEDKIGRFHLRKHQLARITEMMGKHRHTREQVKVRHQRELLLFEQSL